MRRKGSDEKCSKIMKSDIRDENNVNFPSLWFLFY
jgi:hypothetical protein